MYLSMSQAAKEVGKSKSTLSRYIEKGKLSVAEKNEDGSFKIDPAELYRVFPQRSEQGETRTIEQSATPFNAEKNEDGTGLQQGETPLERVYMSTIEDLRQRLNDAEKRLDQERDEARKEREHARDEREKFMLWLEHKPAATPEPEQTATPEQPPRRRWWQRKKDHA